MFNYDNFAAKIREQEQVRVLEKQAAGKQARKVEAQKTLVKSVKAATKKAKAVKDCSESYYGSDLYLEDGNEARGSIYGDY